jgi:hypothetical protein
LIQLYIRHSGEKALAIFLRMKKGGKDGNYVQAHGAEGGAYSSNRAYHGFP